MFKCEQFYVIEIPICIKLKDKETYRSASRWPM